jgi:hypothetical protein
MEIKIADSIPMWLAVKMAELGIYRTSFSKYGTAYKQYKYHLLMEKSEGKVSSIA